MRCGRKTFVKTFAGMCPHNASMWLKQMTAKRSRKNNQKFLIRDSRSMASTIYIKGMCRLIIG
jgi:hypothetical protein